MPSAMVVSVGGSPAPLIHSLNEQQPDYVIYFASKDSRKIIRTEIEPNLIFQPNDCEVITTPDPNDLVLGVHKILKDLPEAMKIFDLQPGDLVADYTGGTKTMSAAVVLALSRMMVKRFSYIGGSKRDKHGLGVVINGHEQALYVENPWDVLAVRDLAEVEKMFNTCRFASAREAASAAAERMDSRKSLFNALTDVSEGCRLMDDFRFKEAAPLLGKAQSVLSNMAEYDRQPSVSRFTDDLKRTRDHLTLIRTDEKALAHRRSGNKSEKTIDKSIGSAYLTEILGNAVRRAEAAQRYDDAVARLYSAIEKMAKIRLLVGHGIDNSNLDLAVIPDAELRAEAERSYRDNQGRLKLPLYKSYCLLSALGDDLGGRFQEREADLRKVLDIRNSSLLAHGFKPVREETYERMLGIALFFFNLAKKDLPMFPRMDWAGLI